jgi:hypothetical protein
MFIYRQADVVVTLYSGVDRIEFQIGVRLFCLSGKLALQLSHVSFFHDSFDSLFTYYRVIRRYAV